MGSMPGSDLQLPEQAIAALQQGRKIEAIQLVRARHGLGLKEAKDRVETYLATQPHLEATMAEAQAASHRGCMMILGALIAAGGLLFYLFSPGARQRGGQSPKAPRSDR
ncbi:MAG: ribosomal protein L7/L12 [Acidobacteria bacterium]|nr:ribosomal protein L7/L12 [Acidobacteriota bacterium]